MIHIQIYNFIQIDTYIYTNYKKFKFEISCKVVNGTKDPGYSILAVDGYHRATRQIH